MSSNGKNASPPSGGEVTDPSEDFVWRFRLDEKPFESICSDPLLEYIRVQWEELLKLSIPYFGGNELKVDGFRLMRDPKTVTPIFEDDPRWGSQQKE